MLPEQLRSISSSHSSVDATPFKLPAQPVDATPAKLLIGQRFPEEKRNARS
jgi:hypothetical protein